MAEVEAQPVRGDERTLLFHVAAQHLAQRGMEQVGRGVVEHDMLAPVAVDGGDHGVAPP